MGNAQEVITLGDRRNKGKGQVTSKAADNKNQIVVGQDAVELLTQSWTQQENWHVVSKTLINGSASIDLNLEIFFTLDNVLLDQTYKQHINQGYNSTSINKLFKDLKSGIHKLVVTAKTDTGNFTIDISNSNQVITYK